MDDRLRCTHVADPGSWRCFRRSPAGWGAVSVGLVSASVAGEARAMHARCSAGTLGSRYRGPVADAGRYLDHLLLPEYGLSVGARAADGSLVGLGHLLWDGEESSAELAVLVEDAWQRRGVGSAIVRELVSLASTAGFGGVFSVVEGGAERAMVGLLGRLGLPLEVRRGPGGLVVSARLAEHALGGGAGGV